MTAPPFAQLPIYYSAGMVETTTARAKSEVGPGKRIAPSPKEQMTEVLGTFGFRWLQACCAMPVLRLPLTLHLGASLSAADGRPPPDEIELLRIASLPWFRQGWIPGPLRKEFLGTQTSTDKRTVRKAIGEIAYAVVDSKNASVSGAVTVGQIGVMPSGWLDTWKDWRDGLPTYAPERDALFVEFMTTPFDRIKRRYGLLIGVAVVLSALAFVVSGDFLGLRVSDSLQHFFFPPRQVAQTASLPLTSCATGTAQSSTADRVKKIIVQHLQITPGRVSEKTSLLSDGFDDLDRVEIIMALEEEFSIEIPDKDAQSIATVGDAISYLQKRLPPGGQGACKNPSASR